MQELHKSADAMNLSTFCTAPCILIKLVSLSGIVAGFGQVPSVFILSTHKELGVYDLAESENV